MKIIRWRLTGRTSASMLAAALFAGAVAIAPQIAHSGSSLQTRQTASITRAALDSATDSSPSSDDSLFIDTAGVYITGHPVDINTDGTPCYPSIPLCPQLPLVPNTYGWQPECFNGGSGDLTDGCGYLFDNSTSSQIVRYYAAGSLGALSTLCGPAALLCGAVAGGVSLYLGDHQDIVAPGRCLYLHAPDITNVVNLLTPLPSVVQARIVDCP